MEDFAPGTYTFLHTFILYYFSLLVIKPETIEFYQKVEGLRWSWKNLIMGKLLLGTFVNELII